MTMKLKTKLQMATALAVVFSALFYGGYRYGRWSEWDHRQIDRVKAFQRGWEASNESARNIADAVTNSANPLHDLITGKYKP